MQQADDLILIEPRLPPDRGFFAGFRILQTFRDEAQIHQNGVLNTLAVPAAWFINVRNGHPNATNRFFTYTYQLPDGDEPPYGHKHIHVCYGLAESMQYIIDNDARAQMPNFFLDDYISHVFKFAILYYNYRSLKWKVLGFVRSGIWHKNP